MAHATLEDRTATSPQPAPNAVVPAQRGRTEAPVHLALDGELDLSNLPATRELLEQTLRTGARNVEVDVSAVTFMDLTTLRLLLSTDAALAARGGSLRLSRPGAAVQRLLAVTRCQHLAQDRQPGPRRPAASG